MKNYLRKFSYLFLCSIGFFLLQSCGDEALLKQIEEQKERIVTLNDSIQKLNDLINENTRPIKKPKQIISLEDATELYNSYTTNRVCIINAYENGKGNIRDICPTERKPKKIIPARSAFMEYKVLKQYIAYVEQETSKRKIPITGFRFYFSNYPDKEKFEDGRPIPSPRRNTFFAAPTIKKESKNLGFTIFESEDGSFETRILEEIFENQTKIGKNINKASFFNINQEFREVSLEINDVGSHP